ncbi:hypothetical protein [Morganella morganii]|uniref:hypothetical protein n=1 Tax=Morganella morganii TaxID=582 RepID=UPI001BDAE2D3|nr:hypothetical protein [Morganella morganii]
MAKRKILTIGFELSDSSVEYSSFDSDLSLLDWDIILFKPDIGEYINNPQSIFQGNPCLSDTKSFKLKEQSEHWRREIKSAVRNGKLVIVFLDELIKISIATGKKEHSGTGKNTRTTRIVETFDNYQCISLDLRPVNSRGKEIKLAVKNSELISIYWQEFSYLSTYKVILSDDLVPCLMTKHGDKTVGTILRSQNSSGALICLPDIDFYPSDFFDDEGNWTKEADQFSAKFIKSIVSLDRALHSEGEVTPEPEWAKNDSYKLQDEIIVGENLLKVEE